MSGGAGECGGDADTPCQGACRPAGLRLRRRTVPRSRWTLHRPFVRGLGRYNRVHPAVRPSADPGSLPRARYVVLCWGHRILQGGLPSLGGLQPDAGGRQTAGQHGGGCRGRHEGRLAQRLSPGCRSETPRAGWPDTGRSSPRRAGGRMPESRVPARSGHGEGLVLAHGPPPSPCVLTWRTESETPRLLSPERHQSYRIRTPLT